jgi:hypothetical protein
MSALLDFFDANKKCPDIISDCVELRKKYFETYDKMTATNCKQCDVVNLKELYLAKIKFSSSPISYKKTVNKKDRYEDILIKEFIALYPIKIVFQIFKSYIKIISFQNQKQRVSYIKKFYLYIPFINGFLLLFFNKDDFLTFYFVLCKNKHDKKMYICSLSLYSFYKYFRKGKNVLFS